MNTGKMCQNSIFGGHYHLHIISSYGELVVMSLTIECSIIIIVNIINNYKNRKYYIQKLHALYPMLCKPTLENSK